MIANSLGAKASDYRAEIAATINAGNIPVLVELNDDLDLLNRYPHHKIMVVDHHGDQAGATAKSSLEQVFELLELPQEQWSRHFQLVAANDIGHARAMLEIGGTLQELQEIRFADRQAQGISSEEEQSGKKAALNATHDLNGRLTIVELPHSRTATVTDVLEKELGGPGYENLLIRSPGQTSFFGNGSLIHQLNAAFSGGWYGGQLPERGFWGICKIVPQSKLIKVLEKAMTSKPASEIEVKAFHQTLMWPLIMRGGDGGSEKTIDPFIAAFVDAGWQEVGAQQKGPHQDFTYEEIVYFHPFVRDLLFGDGKETNEKRTLRRMKRNDLKSVKVTLATGQTPLHFYVERAELLLIRPRVVMLVLEVSNREVESSKENDPVINEPRTKFMLDQALLFQNRFRHIYPPFFYENGNHGDCPVEVCWTRKFGQNLERKTTSPRGEFDTFVRDGAEPPAYAHWMCLFNSEANPNRVRCLRSADDRLDSELYLQQLIDDRMPSMSFIAVQDVDAISQEDQDCLIDFNPSGLTYQRDFQEQIRSLYRYDRFRHLDTTYYCNGTSFSMVCNTGGFSDLLLTHFRRHYTHLAVIAQYQHAGLLYFSDELADIAKLMARHNGDSSKAHSLADPSDWEIRLRRLQHRFLKFRTRSYFTEVSNQIQAKDLFRLWFDRMGTAELFTRVAQTSYEVYEKVENDEMKELTKAQKTLADVATWGLGATIFLAVLAGVIGWAGLFPDDAKQNFNLEGVPVWGPWIWLGASFALAIGGLMLFNFKLKELKRKRQYE